MRYPSLRDRAYKLHERLHQRDDPYSAYNRRKERKEREVERDHEKTWEERERKRDRFRWLGSLYGLLVFGVFVWFVYTLNRIGDGLHLVAETFSH